MKDRKRHDTIPVTFTLTDDDGPVDLSGATVTICLKTGSTIKSSATCAVLAQSTNKGQVKWSPQASEVDTSGAYLVELQAVFADGTKATFPSSGTETLQILDDLDNA